LRKTVSTKIFEDQRRWAVANPRRGPYGVM
jgi:hypothetical protein